MYDDDGIIIMMTKNWYFYLIYFRCGFFLGLSLKPFSPCSCGFSEWKEKEEKLFLFYVWDIKKVSISLVAIRDFASNNVKMFNFLILYYWIHARVLKLNKQMSLILAVGSIQIEVFLHFYIHLYSLFCTVLHKICAHLFGLDCLVLKVDRKWLPLKSDFFFE